MAYAKGSPMNVPPRTKQWSLLLLSVLFCLAVLQACIIVPVPSPQARYATEFHYAQPVPVTEAEATRLKAILAKHHVSGTLTLNGKPILLPTPRLQQRSRPRGRVAHPQPQPQPLRHSRPRCGQLESAASRNARSGQSSGPRRGRARVPQAQKIKRSLTHRPSLLRTRQPSAASAFVWRGLPSTSPSC